MGIENRNLNNLGRSGNAAGGNIGISRDQNITQNQELNNNLNVGPIIINNYTTQINILREPPLAPANPAAAFLNQAAPLCSDILFDDRLGGYTDIQGSKSLTDYLVKIWVETLPLLSQLSGVEVESFFTSQDKDSQKYHAPKDPLEDVEISIQKMIKEALRRSKNVYTTRSNVSPFLISIKENFGCYMTWVGLLPYQDGKSGLCGCIRRHKNRFNDS
ncbi:hypothetical protein F4805DRAFT_3869 [Annulohypoxylon moriforme]|nr:hypothetical protein F4805DRAFT_3869 [Annulohypoxylon moriforme]